MSGSGPLLTNVYIDGFNLYYRALKDTPFRWPDLWKLAEILFPQDAINRVCYFTALLDTRPTTPCNPGGNWFTCERWRRCRVWKFTTAVPVRRQAPSAGRTCARTAG